MYETTTLQLIEKEETTALPLVEFHRVETVAA
jgi:hypothetical protein